MTKLPRVFKLTLLIAMTSVMWAGCGEDPQANGAMAQESLDLQAKAATGQQQEDSQVKGAATQEHSVAASAKARYFRGFFPERRFILCDEFHPQQCRRFGFRYCHRDQIWDISYCTNW